MVGEVAGKNVVRDDPRGRCGAAVVVLAGLVLLGGGRALAGAADALPGAPETPEAPDRRGIFVFQFENDALGTEGSDRHYSNGIRFGWQTAEDRLPGWLSRLARATPLAGADARLRAGLALGHNIYTPEDIKTPELVVDDRPYAGWLHLDLSVVADAGRTFNAAEISVGVVGPAARGEEMQRWFHRVIGSPDPQGWHNQLDDELALLLTYERKWRNLLTTERLPLLGSLGITCDVAPHLGFALGTVFTHGATGLTLRLGNDLPADFGPPRIQSRLPGSEFFVPGRGFGWYLFAGAEGRAVLRNIFLDGNMFRDSHSVAKNPLVGDLQAGLALTALGVRLTFSHVVRTREFLGQRKPDQFGALTLSVRI